MVTPTKVNFDEIISRQVGLVSSYYSAQRRHGQQRPYNLPLPYQRNIAEMRYIQDPTGSLRPNHGASDAATSYDWYVTAEAQHVKNMAYERLKAELGSQANLAVFLAEFSQSVGMVANRLKQLWDFGRALKRGNIVKAANILSTPVPSKASRKKKFADNYLEFHFGWSPLLSDIYSAIEVLQGPFPIIPLRGRASTPITRKLSSGSVSSGIYAEQFWDGVIRCIQGVTVRIDNPALYLANSLGLANPAVVAFELVPFSFVLDWFVNVESFISSMTDFLGLEVSDAFHSVSIKPGGFYNEYKLNYFVVGPFGTRYGVAFGSFGYQKRVLGLSTPTLYVRPWKVPGYRRCLAAASLVVQQLSR